MNLASINLLVNNQKSLFNFRKDSVGDKGVINQILVNHDYDISSWVQGRKLIEYHQRISKNQCSLIVDAGANIGASVLYFSKKYDNSLVFAIEPDELNYDLLTLNSKNLNTFNFRGAISSEDGELLFIDPGHSDWGFRTKKIENNESHGTKKVRAICPSTVINHSAAVNTKPLIFKIDIEGAEADLFSKNTHWMKEFPLIIIELHDWMLPFSGSSKNFIKAVAQYEFDLVYRGENIFLFNRDILS